MTTRTHGCTRVVPGEIAALTALLAIGACCSPQPYTADVDATAIVKQSASDAFATFLDRRADADALRTFDGGIAAAHDRSQITDAWRRVPSLAAKGRDFLEQHVFAVAVREHRWPKDQPAPALEQAFVDGVRAAVAEFLAGH
jgi:uncharacterized iron-regulated protein